MSTEAFKIMLYNADKEREIARDGQRETVPGADSSLTIYRRPWLINAFLYEARVTSCVSNTVKVTRVCRTTVDGILRANVYAIIFNAYTRGIRIFFRARCTLIDSTRLDSTRFRPCNVREFEVEHVAF